MAQLNKELALQQQLMEQVRACLPPPLDQQLLAAVLNGRALTLWVNSPAWASRLRYLAPQLMRQLGRLGLMVEHLHPRIIPAQVIGKRGGRRQPTKLSENSAKLLRQTAEALEDGPLQEALKRLSRHR